MERREGGGLTFFEWSPGLGNGHDTSWSDLLTVSIFDHQYWLEFVAFMVVPMGLIVNRQKGSFKWLAFKHAD